MEEVNQGVDARKKYSPGGIFSDRLHSWFTLDASSRFLRYQTWQHVSLDRWARARLACLNCYSYLCRLYGGFPQAETLKAV